MRTVKDGFELLVEATAGSVDDDEVENVLDGKDPVDGADSGREREVGEEESDGDDFVFDGRTIDELKVRDS